MRGLNRESSIVPGFTYRQGVGLYPGMMTSVVLEVQGPANKQGSLVVDLWSHDMHHGALLLATFAWTRKPPAQVNLSNCCLANMTDSYTP